MFLSQLHPHPRDQHITFKEEGHQYTIHTDPDGKYTSVTTWCHSHFPKFDADTIIAGMMRGRNWKPGHKYWGQTAEEIKTQWSTHGASVSQAGTNLHRRIEAFMNPNLPPNPELPFALLPVPLTHRQLLEPSFSSSSSSVSLDNTNEEPEWKFFLNFVRDHPTMKPYRTEWMIYDEDIHLSGSIDMVYENQDGTLSIYDWKRSKQITKVNPYNKFALTPELAEMPDSNFWHYALQLNCYKVILETKYGKQIRDLCLVQLHPDADEGNYELYPVPDLSPRVRALFAHLRDA